MKRFTRRTFVGVVVGLVTAWRSVRGDSKRSEEDLGFAFIYCATAAGEKPDRPRALISGQPPNPWVSVLPIPSKAAPWTWVARRRIVQRRVLGTRIEYGPPELFSVRYGYQVRKADFEFGPPNHVTFLG